MTRTKKLAPTWLDRAIGWVNPRAGLKRASARDMLARAYEGASRADGWRPRRAGASARTDHLADARELRHRARPLVGNVPYITLAAVASERAAREIADDWNARRIVIRAVFNALVLGRLEVAVPRFELLARVPLEMPG